MFGSRWLVGSDREDAVERTDGREDGRRSGLRSRGDRRLLHRPHERSLGVESIAELVAAATKKVDGCGQC